MIHGIYLSIGAFVKLALITAPNFDDSLPSASSFSSDRDDRFNCAIAVLNQFHLKAKPSIYDFHL